MDDQLLSKKKSEKIHLKTHTHIGFAHSVYSLYMFEYVRII